MFRLSTLALILLACLHLTPSRAQVSAASIREYNEACRLATRGDAPGALAAFHRAVELGFDDVDFAWSDPDLSSLRDEPDFRDFITARQAALQLDSAARGLRLAGGIWSEALPLAAEDGTGAGPLLRLRWQPLGLDFDLTSRQEWSSLGEGKVPAPWSGGPGLILTLAVPDGPPGYSSGTTFLTAFGLEKNTPVGGLYHPAAGWQRVLELDPEIHLDPATRTLSLRGTIPWQTIQPFHPLVDTRLGFNAVLRVPGPPGGEMRQAQAFPDPAALLPDRPHRVIPLDFAPGTATREDVAGRLGSARNIAPTVELSLGIVAEEAGRGILTVDFTDNRQNSVVPGGPLSLPLDLEAGHNQWQQSLDVGSLLPGLYTARINLEFPSGRTGVWNSSILQLGPGWTDSTHTRVENLADWARPTGRHYLQAINRALREENPRLDPGPVATTVDLLEGMLRTAQGTGTILPETGLLGMAYPGPDGQERLAGLYLPPNWRQRGPVQPVLVLGEAQLITGRLTGRLARSYTFDGHLDPTRKTTSHSPVYLIPQLPALQGAVLEQARAEIRALQEWTASAFASDRVALCGVDFYGAAVLTLLRDRQPSPAGVQVMAGSRLAPWPQATNAFVDEQLSPAVTGVPITWLDFRSATRGNEQAQQLLDSLVRVGYDVESQENIKGGLNHTQIADRVVLWAESLP